MRVHATWLILAFAGQAMAGPSAAEIRDSVRTYRQQHEPAIVGEFAQLLAIPNHASDTANVRRNAELIAQALRDRQVDTKLLELEGAPPVVFGKLDAPGATRTVTFYAHYDGQPTRQSGHRVENERRLRRAERGSAGLHREGRRKAAEHHWRARIHELVTGSSSRCHRSWLHG